MKKALLASLAIFFCAATALAQPPVRHSVIGKSVTTSGGELTITSYGKKQNYSAADAKTRDTDIHSPKSANIHPDGKRYYVNSLEGCKTIVYDLETHKKLKVINHSFDETRDAHLWSKPSDLYPFTHYTKNLNTFSGKPVESTFSHGGRYLWVPYYRRTYDINAQDPSAVAIIDTEKDEIVKLMETGPLPKMIACSHDGRHIAITHWGNNTVGIVNVASSNPDEWYHEKLLVVDYVLPLNYSLTRAVDRDNDSGYALRGTVFSPDDRYLIVGCMGGNGGIAVIDMETQEYLGRVLGMMPNVRHLVIKNGYLYLSINRSGHVQRIQLDKFLEAAKNMTGKTTTLTGWESCQVGGGARTIELSPSGNFVFAACNAASQVCVVDTRTMKMIGAIDCDSYPVGLDISRDGKYVIVTSQGRKDRGGNAVNIYKVDYAEEEPLAEVPNPVTDEQQAGDSAMVLAAAGNASSGGGSSLTANWWLWAGIGAVALVAIFLLVRGRFGGKLKIED